MQFSHPQNEQPSSPRSSEVYGQLIPLQGSFLILPKLAVLEVLGMDAVAVETAGPAWLLGVADWHAARVPVVSIEAMAGAPLPVRSRRTRVVVINGFGEHLDNGLFIVLAQGYPHLTALNAKALIAQPKRPEDQDIALSRVRLASTPAIIPDLESIEMRIAAAMRQVDVGAPAGDWEPRSYTD